MVQKATSSAGLLVAPNDFEQRLLDEIPGDVYQ
jgi:hypothetical protein